MSKNEMSRGNKDIGHLELIGVDALGCGEGLAV